MKPRHAAALALVGWYLMTPPLYKDGELDEKAPLKEWTIINSFDTATECSESVIETSRQMNADTTTSNVVRRRLMLSACISTDDPRLAK